MTIKGSYLFKPPFLEKMGTLQLQSWVMAAEEIMTANHIAYFKHMERGGVAFQLLNEQDYNAICQLSTDIGQRALSIESNYLSDIFDRSGPTSVVGHA